MIVGANGCGKSTLLRGLGRLLRPVAGQRRLGGQDIAALRPRQVAAVLGLLPQQPVAPEGITVADLVARGRHPHQGVFRRARLRRRDAVARALAATDTHELAGRRVDELSGGQRQRVWVAMMLAQDPRIMLLDEPTTYLDIAHQVDVLDLLAELNQRARDDRGDGAARPQPRRALRPPPRGDGRRPGAASRGRRPRCSRPTCVREAFGLAAG